MHSGSCIQQSQGKFEHGEQLAFYCCFLGKMKLLCAIHLPLESLLSTCSFEKSSLLSKEFVAVFQYHSELWPLCRKIGQNTTPRMHCAIFETRERGIVTLCCLKSKWPSKFTFHKYVKAQDQCNLRLAFKS